MSQVEDVPIAAKRIKKLSNYVLGKEAKNPILGQIVIVADTLVQLITVEYGKWMDDNKVVKSPYEFTLNCIKPAMKNLDAILNKSLKQKKDKENEPSNKDIH